MTQIQIKRGLEADRSSVTPAAGELIYTTDEKKVYIGDGTTAGGNQVGGGDIIATITGPSTSTNMAPNTAYTFTLTNYDSYTTYSLSSSNGTVTQSTDTITYTTGSGTGTGAASFVINSRTIGPFDVQVPASQQAYTTPGTYSWVAPAGVTSVSVVAVGAGGQGGWYNRGGGGGGLGYKNAITVSPGTSYTVVVGNKGTGNGGESYFDSTATARGGGGAWGNLGGAGGTYTGDGGGTGGLGGLNTNGCTNDGGGGGAAGYSGNGGAGGGLSTPTAGSGGGGGGNSSGPGGGVGILGEGSSGAAYGFPGSGGVGVNYGGGGSQSSQNQGTGAVRIIWAGSTGITRAFPSTNTGDY